MPTEDLLATWRARVDAGLERALAPLDAPCEPLLAAMRHAVLGGGKRMRPLLVYAAGHAAGAATDALDEAAVAVELIHAYSLVHDDLPAMDDDALRRGRPTVHVAFDEATAIIAGDALQALAFATLVRAPLEPGQVLAMLRELSEAAGHAGMCGGQALDMAATGHGEPDDGADALAALEQLHALKTGALIRAAVRLGAIGADAPAPLRATLDDYADALGLAFQIRDDLLDVEGDAATLGKTAGKDQAQRKATFPSLLGADASRGRLQALAARMDTALDGLDQTADPLRRLGRLAAQRDR